MIKRITCQQLRNLYRIIMQRVQRGERFMVTRYGKDMAIIEPYSPVQRTKEESLKPLETAFQRRKLNRTTRF